MAEAGMERGKLKIFFGAFPGAGSRATIWVDLEDAALAGTDVAAEITSVDGTPIVVERSLYLREDGSAAPRGGDTCGERARFAGLARLAPGRAAGRARASRAPRSSRRRRSP